MSNLDTLHRAEAAFNSGDLDEIRAVVAPDVQWGTTGSFPGVAPLYSGSEGMLRWIDDMRTAWQDFTVRVEEVLHDGADVLVVEDRVHGRGLNSGVEVEMSIFSVYRFHGGRIVARVAYQDREQALAAAAVC